MEGIPRKRMKLRSDTKRELELQNRNAASSSQDNNLEVPKRKRANKKDIVPVSTVHITDLPRCILMNIFENLTFTDMVTVQNTCPHFGDICELSFNHGFRKLKPMILNMIRRVECRKGAWAKIPDDSSDVLTQSANVLRFLLRQVNLIRAMAYRVFFLSPARKLEGVNVGSGILTNSAALIDDVYKMLRMINTKEVNEIDAWPLREAVETWVEKYHDEFEPFLFVHPSVKPECRSAMFGSRIVDLLECFEGIEKKLEVNVDKGWCKLKGTYRVPRVFFTCVVNTHEGHEHEHPLNYREQRCLHDSLRALVLRNNDFHSKAGCATETGAGSTGKTKQKWFEGLYQGTNQCGSGNLYFYGYLSRLSSSNLVTEDLCEVTFHVDLNCRIELAPVEMMLERERDQERELEIESEEEKMEESEDTTGPDLTLRLDIDCPVAGNSVNRLSGHYSCLIQQKIQREEILPKDMTYKELKKEHQLNISTEQKVHRTTRLREYELAYDIFDM